MVHPLVFVGFVDSGRCRQLPGFWLQEKRCKQDMEVTLLFRLPSCAGA